ncbi:hypothetical protein PTTG_26904 [Puccinia triticina 1-1 BBBD Race 1]|uniref:CULLIN_2 domain-containing protein n=2 Tax=Puccinia triticina TaxID=208348 RepID=A0A180GPN1_PUCT1|nr:hypothetical protein PTTG_26904 [Puccinia triticina 1-1 BBBD Race 1]
MFYAIREAFKKLINKRCNKPAELLAKFLNLQMLRICLKSSMNTTLLSGCCNPECGPGFMAKLEVLFQDLETSSDLNKAEATRKEGGHGEGVELTVTVLMSGSWPMSQSNKPKVLLPTRLQSHLT